MFRFLKKPEDFEQDIIMKAKAIDNFMEYHQNYIEDMKIFRENCLKKGFKLQNWFDGIKNYFFEAFDD